MSGYFKNVTGSIVGGAGVPTSTDNPLPVKIISGSGPNASGKALTFTETFNNALTVNYQKVCTTTAATQALRMSAACNAGAYDIEFQVVAAGAAAPSTTGMALLAGDDFPLGIPIGDIYARSASLQRLIVWSA